MKKIKKVVISVIMAIMLLPKKIFASFDPSTFEELYGPPTEILYGPPELMDEPTFIESIWRMVKTCILPISLVIIFIVGSIIFFKKSKATTKEKIDSLTEMSKINRFIDTIKQFAGRVPELTQRVTRKLKQTKEKILDDFERRFSKDMKNYEQEQQKSLEKQANRDVQSEKKPTKDHDRGMSR